MQVTMELSHDGTMPLAPSKVCFAKAWTYGSCKLVTQLFKLAWHNPSTDSFLSWPTLCHTTMRAQVDKPIGAVSITTGGRNDHWFLIMLGGVGPESVGRPPAMSSANLRNSCSQDACMSRPTCQAEMQGRIHREVSPRRRALGAAKEAKNMIR